MLTPALICTLVLIAINPNTHELDAVTVIGTKTQRTLKSQPGTITVKTSEALKRELAPDQGMFFIPVLEMAEAADGKVANHATKLKFVKALHVYLLNDKP